jgi:hypothetical protein
MVLIQLSSTEQAFVSHHSLGSRKVRFKALAIGHHRYLFSTDWRDIRHALENAPLAPHGWKRAGEVDHRPRRVCTHDPGDPSPVDRSQGWWPSCGMSRGSIRGILRGFGAEGGRVNKDKFEAASAS